MNVPKLRFKEFTGEWETISFGDFFDFLKTNSFSRERMRLNNGIIQNIHYGDILTKLPAIVDLNKVTLPFLDSTVEVTKEILSGSIIKDGDVVIADTAEDYAVGMACEIIGTKNKTVVSGLHTMLCRKKRKYSIALGYLGYYVNSYKYHRQLLPLVVGTKVYAINKKEIQKTILNIPKVDEQNKIVDLLMTVDEKIKSLQKITEILIKQKRSLLQKIFSQELRFKDDDGKEFPAWKENRDAIKIVSGNTYPLSSYSIDGILLIQGVNIHPGKLIFDDIIRIDDGCQGDNHMDIYKNDILLGLNRPIVNGEVKVCLVDIDEKAFLYQRAGVLKFNTQKIYYAYLYQYLRSDEFKRRLRNELVGSDQPYIKSNLFEVIKPSIPCFKEQEKIATFLTQFDEKIKVVEMILEHWGKVKKGLLQQMFV